MTQATPTGRVIARIQRLCCLGLSDQIVIPQLLRDLQDLVPSHGNTFFWAGPQQELANIYTESPCAAEVAPLYLQEFHNRREREVMLTFTDVMRANYASPACDFFERVLKVDRREFMSGDLYNLIIRPLGWERMIQLKITRQGPELGALNMGRVASDPDFTRREVRLLEAIAPFVAHALTHRTPADPFVDSEDSGLVIADGKGCVQYLSRGAARLLLMVRYPSWSPARQMRGHVLPDEVVRLCHSLAAQREDRPLPAPPVWRHLNAWGEFIFHLHCMEHETPTAAHLVGVSITRREPLRLKLLRRINELPLSHRESQLCHGLAAGHSRARLADDMGITEHTVITHCRNLYAKLDVHTRAELTEKLCVT